MDPIWSGVVGAAVGGTAGILGQLLAQGRAFDRDRIEDERRDERIRALFAGRIRDVATLVRWQAEDGGHWDLDLIETRATALNDLASDPALVLALRSDVIDAYVEARELLAIGIPTARREQQRSIDERARSASRAIEILDREGRNRQAIFQRSHEALEKLAKLLRDSRAARPL